MAQAAEGVPVGLMGGKCLGTKIFNVSSSGIGVVLPIATWEEPREEPFGICDYYAPEKCETGSRFICNMSASQSSFPGIPDVYQQPCG